MTRRDYRDIIAGLALTAAGAFASLYGLSTLRMGTLDRMGPGMFPVAVGMILAAFGLAVLVPALFRRGQAVHIDFTALAAITAAMLSFALLIRPFGMVPAIVVMTVVAALADRRLSVPGVLVMAAALSVVGALIFGVGLGVPVSLISWPW